MTHLIFVGEVGKLEGNNLDILGSNMWLGGVDQLVLWVSYNENPIRQHFILHVTILET